jgi:hypothetical protein
MLFPCFPQLGTDPRSSQTWHAVCPIFLPLKKGGNAHSSFGVWQERSVEDEISCPTASDQACGGFTEQRQVK